MRWSKIKLKNSLKFELENGGLLNDGEIQKKRKNL